jgi:hypothetical protein
VKTLLDAYGTNGYNRGQLEAIENYTRKYTVTHSIATFLTLFKGGSQYETLIKKFQAQAFTEGFAAIVISVAGKDRVKT